MVIQPVVTVAKTHADIQKNHDVSLVFQTLLVGKLLYQVAWNMETQKPVVEQVHLGNWNNVFPTYTC